MKYNTEIRGEYHEIANMEPMMQEVEMDLLVQSMEMIGYDKSQPITFYEGKILDGRNRYVASEYLGIEPFCKYFEGTYQEALEEAGRLNDARRNKSPSQKAMVAAFAVHANRINRDSHKNELLEKNPSLSKEQLSRKIGQKYPKLSVADAAVQYGSGIQYVKNAMKIIEFDIDIANDVFDGTTSLTKALKTIDEIKDLKRKAKTGQDGEYTPEDLRRFTQVNFIRSQPEVILKFINTCKNATCELKRILP